MPYSDECSPPCWNCSVCDTNYATQDEAFQCEIACEDDNPEDQTMEDALDSGFQFRTVKDE